jgi:hypothetical protein
MAQTTEQFQKGYAQFLAKAWTDPNFFNAAKKDPVTTLSEAGISLKSGANVSFIYPQGHPDISQQTALWLQGNQSGTYQFVLPPSPPSSTLINNPNKIAADDTYCCCCCPSCCTC